MLMQALLVQVAEGVTVELVWRQRLHHHHRNHRADQATAGTVEFLFSVHYHTYMSKQLDVAALLVAGLHSSLLSHLP